MKNCPVFEVPDRKSEIQCRSVAGSEVEVRNSHGEFAEVTGGDCQGFTPRRCLKDLSKRSPRPARSAVLMAVSANLGGVWSKLPAVSERPNGAGYGVALSVILVPSNFRFSLSPTYQNISLTRFVDGSGAITDPGVEVTHSGHYLGAGFMASMNLDSDSASVFSVDVGLQYLNPLSVTQTFNSRAAEVAGSGFLCFLMVGGSVVNPVRDSEIELGLHGVYNLATDGRHHLYGMRLSVAYLL